MNDVAKPAAQETPLTRTDQIKAAFARDARVVIDSRNSSLGERMCGVLVDSAFVFGTDWNPACDHDHPADRTAERIIARIRDALAKVPSGNRADATNVLHSDQCNCDQARELFQQKREVQCELSHVQGLLDDLRKQKIELRAELERVLRDRPLVAPVMGTMEGANKLRTLAAERDELRAEIDAMRIYTVELAAVRDLATAERDALRVSLDLAAQAVTNLAHGKRGT